MARPGPTAPEERRQQDEGREQRLAALRICLQEEAQEVRTAEDWVRCLRAAAQLPAETWANVLLISSRIPAVTVVKGYEAWRAFGRQVNRDEKGIEIFSGAQPHNENRPEPGADEQGHSWRDADRITYAWDLSQTSGQPLSVRATSPPPAGEVPPGLWDALCWLARREGFAVERETGCPDDGTTLWAARRIRVLPGITSRQASELPRVSRTGNSWLIYAAVPIPSSSSMTSRGVLYPSVE